MMVKKLNTSLLSWFPKGDLDLDVIKKGFFQFSIRNMVFHCIFLGKKAIIIISKHGTRIFFPITILF